MAKFEMKVTAAKRIAANLSLETNSTYKTVIDLLAKEGFNNPTSSYTDLMRVLRDQGETYTRLVEWLGLAAAQEAHYLSYDLKEIQRAIKTLQFFAQSNDDKGETR